MGKNNKDVLIIDGISSDELILNESKTRKVLKDMDKQLHVLEDAWMDINHSINKLVNQNVIKGKHGENLKSMIKQSKIQSSAAKKLSSNLIDKFEEDVKIYPIQLLDKRISVLEEKIAHMVEE